MQFGQLLYVIGIFVKHPDDGHNINIYLHYM